MEKIYVTESMKTGLIAYRQVWRKGGFNYLISVVGTIYNRSLPLQLSSIQVAKKQVSPPI